MLPCLAQVEGCNHLHASLLLILRVVVQVLPLLRVTQRREGLPLPRLLLLLLLLLPPVLVVHMQMGTLVAALVQLPLTWYMLMRLLVCWQSGQWGLPRGWWLPGAGRKGTAAAPAAAAACTGHPGTATAAAGKHT